MNGLRRTLRALASLGTLAVAVLVACLLASGALASDGGGSGGSGSGVSNGTAGGDGKGPGDTGPGSGDKGPGSETGSGQGTANSEGSGTGPGENGNGSNGSGDSSDDPGEGGSNDDAAGDAGLGKPEKPVPGEQVNAKPEKGNVVVKLPNGKVVPLPDTAAIPVGSVVDARHGAVKIMTGPNSDGSPQFATLSGGVFKLVQSRKHPLVTEFRLRGGDFGSCASGAAFGRSLRLPLASASRYVRPVRKLWGSGRGHFKTRGRFGAATVRGTVWLTADRCDGTLVRVKRGLVDVTDFARHRSFSVPAGHRRFVPKP